MREGEGGGERGGEWENPHSQGISRAKRICDSVSYIHDLVHTSQCCDVIFNGGTK